MFEDQRSLNFISNVKPNHSRSKICARCWVPLEPGSVVACPSCPLASYCGQECRQEDREDHLQECTVLGPAGLNISDQLRFVSFLEFILYTTISSHLQSKSAIFREYRSISCSKVSM